MSTHRHGKGKYFMTVCWHIRSELSFTLPAFGSFRQFENKIRSLTHLQHGEESAGLLTLEECSET